MIKSKYGTLKTAVEPNKIKTQVKRENKIMTQVKSDKIKTQVKGNGIRTQRIKEL